MRIMKLDNIVKEELEKVLSNRNNYLTNSDDIKELEENDFLKSNQKDRLELIIEMLKQ